MEEYIERNAAVEALTLHDCDSAGAKVAILDLPAADVAPVIRCKDCKYYNRNLGEEKKTCIYLACTTHALEKECIVGEDDFCSHAEKKS